VSIALSPPASARSMRSRGVETPSHQCYDGTVPRELTQRELRNDSGEVMRALDRGESFVITRRGVAVGELAPVGRRRRVSADALLDAFAKAPAIDADRLRSDLDALAEQDPEPRA
jgi:antitoxin (DNA-binding transcriptional repressor) of toxin-antitoxin stability system